MATRSSSPFAPTCRRTSTQLRSSLRRSGDSRPRCNRNSVSRASADASGRARNASEDCARPPLANDRLQKLPDGRFLLELKTRWRDGTTHLKFDPIELMERLAAQIPKPHVNLVLYAGVLAPNAKLRKHVVAYARPPAPLPEEPNAPGTQTRAEKETWAALMRATFDLDVLACARCGGRMRHIATILDARIARKILEHVGLPARAPPEAPAKDPPPFWP